MNMQVKQAQERIQKQGETGQNLIAAEARDKGYAAKKKPIFNQVNILGNMKSAKLTRTISSGGVSTRPAIVSATGGLLTTKVQVSGEVELAQRRPMTSSQIEGSPLRAKIRPKSTYCNRNRYAGVKLNQNLQIKSQLSHKQNIEKFILSLLKRREDKESPLSKPCLGPNYLKICKGDPHVRPFNESFVPFIHGSNLPETGKEVTMHFRTSSADINKMK